MATELRDFSSVGDGRGLSGVRSAVSLLEDVKKARRITLTFNVSAFVPVLAQHPPEGGQQPEADKGAQQDAGKEKQVLFDVQGVVEPGQILALMGPSGSGKSSLLTALAGRSTARLVGDVLFNGQRMSKAVKRSMGFVTQDDLLFAELTTYETLYFAAMLRLPRDWTKEMKLKRVEMVIEGLGLGNCRNTPIGDHFVRGVSGGERKRVSIGHELLINPSVIMLDEPTSGLDSTTALKLVQTLRTLATGGRSIIASIHQPSSRLYQEFDQLLLLSTGHTMYYGDAQICPQWFALHGAGVPFGVSTPDHILDLACGDIRQKSVEESKEIQDRLIHAFANRTIGKGPLGISRTDFPDTPTDDSSAGLTALPLPPDAWPTKSSGPRPSPSSLSSTAAPDAVRKQASTMEATSRRATSDLAAGDADEDEGGGSAVTSGARWMDQVRILTARCILVRRQSAFSIQNAVEIMVPAVFAGLFWWRSGDSGTLSEQDVNNLAGLLFFQMMWTSVQSMYRSLFTFPSDFAMLKKERASGMYTLSAYYTARTVSDVPMECLIPVLFSIIIYWMSGVRVAAGSFFANLASTVLTVLVGQSFGLFIGATITNLRTGMASMTVFVLGAILVAGYFVQDVPVWIAWMKYLSYFYYSFNLLLKIAFSGRGYSCTDYYLANPDAPAGQTWCPISESGLLPVNPDSPVTFQVLMLLAFLFVLRIATYCALKYHTSFKPNH